MNTNTLPHIQAAKNLEALSRNAYPGRGLIVGLSSDGNHMVQAYWMMGRKPSSRNRIFVMKENGTVETSFIDPDQAKDAKLLIYKAMAEYRGSYIVGNGDQVDTVIWHEHINRSFQEVMNIRTYEPDGPNFTPRITAICADLADKPFVEMSLLRKSAFGDGCDRFLYRQEQFEPGLGYCLTTYINDGDPLPAFRGEPYLLPLQGGIHDVTATLWETLDEENRVALVVKFIKIDPNAKGANAHMHESVIDITNKYPGLRVPA